MPGSAAEAGSRAGPGDRIPVTVVAGGRRVDVSLPAAVPVAEVVPHVARALGVDGGAATSLSRPDGTCLAPGSGVAVGGVRPGDVLVLGEAPPPPRRYDDAAEAAAELTDGDGVGITVQIRQAATALASWGSIGVAGAAGWVLAGSGGTGDGLAVVGCVVVVLAIAVASRPGPLRWAVVPLAPVGAVVAVSGLATRLPQVSLSVLMAVAAVGLVVGSRALPTAVLAGSTGRHATRVVDQERLAADLRFAGALLQAGSVATSVLVVLAVPVLVATGRSGALLAVACCVLLAVRDRAVRREGLRLGSVLGGLVGLLVAAVSWLVLHPGAAPVVLGCSAVVMVLLGSGIRPRESAYAARALDALEAIALLSLAPLLVLTTGLLEVLPG